MKKFLVIFLIIFAAKAAATFAFPSPWVFGDEYIYTAKTRAILNEGNFNFDKYHYGGPDVPPLYSIVLLPAYLFENINTSYHFILIWNALLSTLAIIPIFLISRKFVRQWQALLISGVCGLLPAGFGYANMIMAENIFSPLFVWSVYFIYKMLTDKKTLRWEIALGLAFAAMFLAKVTAVAPIAAYALFAFIKCFTLKKKTNFIAGQLIVVLVAVAASSWWFLIKEGSSTGYDTENYIEIIRGIFSLKEKFFTLLKLISNEMSYIGLSSWFFGLPLLLSYLWVPKKHKELRELLPCVGYIILTLMGLAGISALHMLKFIDINQERYAIFGRYVEAVMPVIIGFASILLFQSTESLPRLWRGKALGLFLLWTVFVILVLPRIPYDLVANIPIWSLQFLSANMVNLLLITAAGLVFFAIIAPKKFASVFLLAIIAGSVLLMPLPYKDGLRQSREINEQTIEIRNWINENVAPGEIVGFDETHLWDRNYIRQFWAYKFWLKNPIEKVSVSKNPHKYLISSEKLSYKAVEKGWELNLYEIR